jgi:uncharacterized Fe-S cluster protein YjdI
MLFREKIAVHRENHMEHHSVGCVGNGALFNLDSNKKENAFR